MTLISIPRKPWHKLEASLRTIDTQFQNKTKRQANYATYIPCPHKTKVWYVAAAWPAPFTVCFCSVVNQELLCQTEWYCNHNFEFGFEY